MKITNLFGKQVYSLYEGEIVGTIAGANFNKNLNKISAFKIFDNEENEFALPLASIKAFNDCIVITNKNKLEVYVNQTEKSPMFKEVIDQAAKTYGKIVNAEVDENGNIINFITDQNKVLLPQNIYPCKNFIYYSEVKINIKNFKPKKSKYLNLNNIKVNILNTNSKYTNFLPQKVQYNPENIIGKTSKSDLLGINNEIIIKANQIITEKIIDDATRHNRLNQLFFLAM